MTLMSTHCGFLTPKTLYKPLPPPLKYPYPWKGYGFASGKGKGRCRDCHGLPWGFSQQPMPIPVKTRTCTKCMGFYTYGSRVGYNPQVSKPVQIKAWVHIKSDSNVEKNYQGLLNPNPYPYPYAPTASTRTGLQTRDIP